jgi:hypothetical protein
MANTSPIPFFLNPEKYKLNPPRPQSQLAALNASDPNSWKALDDWGYNPPQTLLPIR